MYISDLANKLSTCQLDDVDVTQAEAEMFYKIKF